MSKFFFSERWRFTKRYLTALSVKHIHTGIYRVSHEKSLKLIGNYFEMDANTKMAQIASKRRYFEVFFVYKFIKINNILIHLLSIF